MSNLCAGGYAEILVLQRDMARIYGHPAPETNCEVLEARSQPWRFLADTELGLHAACLARTHIRYPLQTPYRPEPPMIADMGPSTPRRGSRRASRISLVIPPEGRPSSVFDTPPIVVGPPMGPLAILPEQYSRLYDIEEYESEIEGEGVGEEEVVVEGEDREGSSLGSGDAAGDGRVARRRERVRSESWRDRLGRGRRWTTTDWTTTVPGARRPGAPLPPRPVLWPPEREDVGGDGADEGGERRTGSRRIPSRIVIEGSESSIVADTGNVDGGVDEGGSVRVRSVRVRLSISRETELSSERED